MHSTACRVSRKVMQTHTRPRITYGRIPAEHAALLTMLSQCAFLTMGPDVQFRPRSTRAPLATLQVSPYSLERRIYGGSSRQICVPRVKIVRCTINDQHHDGPTTCATHSLTRVATSQIQLADLSHPLVAILGLRTSSLRQLRDDCVLSGGATLPCSTTRTQRAWSALSGLSQSDLASLNPRLRRVCRP